MTVQLNIKSLNKLEEDSSKTIHYLPCKIQANCKANVSQYFSRFILDKDDQTQEVAFRGRPFCGKVINLPDSYKGVVFLETLKPKSLKGDRKFHAVRSFRSFSYWNWDKVPSKNDALMCALDWVDISEAVHSPLENAVVKNERENEKENFSSIGNKEEKKNRKEDDSVGNESVKIESDTSEPAGIRDNL